ncbi:MAG: hypothetical protein DWQ02_01745 [Bacteroidetes bacterium]|nr:MAG: hypothetical protein DWQ02_01745 [Bacteroidota bacterium]
MKEQNGTNQSGLDTFEHVVVLMLENRSFDNLLGYLYDDKKGVPKGCKFEGLQGKTIKMPVPKRAKDFDKHKFVEPREAQDYHQPYPDPGEVYQHVNTQIYNHVDNHEEVQGDDPEGNGNIGVEACKMKPPYNIPNPKPTGDKLMKGFVNDYINTLDALGKVKEGKIFNKHTVDYTNPGYDLYNVIMQCFRPEQIPVLTTLAKDFAVFDHWFCSVPSQTWCNRAFWHAGTSGGEVVNPTDECGLKEKGEAMKNWIDKVWSQPNLFQRMKGKNVTHAVYIQDIFSLTSLVTGLFKDENVRYTGKRLCRFKRDLRRGRLPQYSFLEPKFLGQHNDQHPSSAAPSIDDGPTRVGTVLLGERLIYDVYNSIRKSRKYRDKTLFIITYDEHGGCFDHVTPPSAVPPHPDMVGDKGFKFDRLGVRVPMVMISSFIEKNTIVNDQFDHSSFIKTMCEKWRMKGLTDRDKKSNSFGHIFSKKKRKWPKIPKPRVPRVKESTYLNDPLNDLQKSILVAADHLARENQKTTALFMAEAPAVENIQTVGDAMKHLKKIKDLIPGS